MKENSAPCSPQQLKSTCQSWWLAKRWEKEEHPLAIIKKSLFPVTGFQVHAGRCAQICPPAGCVIIICSSLKHWLCICGYIVYCNALREATAVFSITQWGRHHLVIGTPVWSSSYTSNCLDILNLIRDTKCMNYSRSDLSPLRAEYTLVSVPEQWRKLTWRAS